MVKIVIQEPESWYSYYCTSFSGHDLHVDRHFVKDLVFFVFAVCCLTTLGLFPLIWYSSSYIFLKISGNVILMPLENRSSSESDNLHPNGTNKSFEGGAHVEVAEEEDPELEVC